MTGGWTGGRVIAASTGSTMRGKYSQSWAVGSAEKENLIAGFFYDGDGGEDAAKANAELTAEAFNVANETGLTPRQLADQNKELLAALREVIPANLCTTNPNVADNQIIPVDVTMGEFRKIAALIAKCTGAA